MDLDFKNITYAHMIANDILIVGSDLGPSDNRDHNRCLIQVLNHCQEVGLKLNAAKCICRATGVEKDPMATQNIRCLWRGGGAALIQTK